MQDRYNETRAIKAIKVFKTAIASDNIKRKLGNSNKNLVTLALLAYFGKCSNVKLSKALPSTNTATAIKELEAAGYLTKGREGRDVYYNFVDHSDFNNTTFKYNKYSPYLFANALLNVSTYIKEYNIRSWNVLALMLEIALKCDFEKDATVNLSDTSIQTIAGGFSNRMNLRKTFEKMGVIKNVRYGRGNHAIGSDFKVNKAAYIFQYS